MVDSARDTATEDIEVVCYVDTDEPRLSEYRGLDVKLFTTPRTTLSKYWNMACERATGDIFMHCGDDLIFRTHGWDEMVKNKFEEYPDRIVFVHGNDGHPDKDRAKGFGTHGFLHKNWVDAVGYFVPPHFSSDYNDTWLNDVSEMIHRKAYVPILTEHMHPAFQKGELDKTHQERIIRHQTDNVDQLYSQTIDERRKDAEKLRKVMRG